MKKLIVRIYEYQNTSMGYGDDGTFKYIRMDEDNFITINDRVKLSDKGLEYLKNIKGYNPHDMGFEFSTIAKYNKEIKKLTDHIRSISLV